MEFVKVNIFTWYCYFFSIIGGLALSLIILDEDLFEGKLFMLHIHMNGTLLKIKGSKHRFHYMKFRAVVEEILSTLLGFIIFLIFTKVLAYILKLYW